MKKIFLCETRSPNLLIFGISHHLMEFYQVYSNYSPGAKKGPALGVTCFHRLIKGKCEKKSSCLKLQGLEP